jgi:hypothetical protein
MRKRILLYFIMFISIISVFYTSIVYLYNKYLDSKYDIITITANDFQREGITAYDFQGTPKIRRLQAVNIAKREWYNNVNNDNISAQINLITYCNYANNSPAWILSFRGLKIPSNRPLNRDGKPIAPERYHTEDNVVIDANTGKSLFAFTFR